MEQPVRSFASFIRTASPHPAHPPPHNKPLPAIPSSRVEQTKATSSPLSSPLDRKIVWKAPTEWDDPDSVKRDPRILSSSPALSYELVIAEPSPCMTDNEESSVWPIPSVSMQPLHVEPDDTQGNRDQSSSPYDASYSLSTSGPNEKAFASLGIGSLANTDDDLKLSHTRQESLPTTNHNDALLSTLDMEIQSLNHETVQNDDDDDNSDASSLDEKLQKLGVSQDYHNLLVEQYHEAHTQDSQSKMKNFGKEDATNRTSRKSLELIPQPLTWNKGLIGFSAGRSRAKIQAGATSSAPDVSRGGRKLPLRMPFHQLSPSRKWSSRDKEPNQSIHDSKISPGPPSLEPDKNRLLHKHIHLSHLVPLVKTFKSTPKDTNTPDTSTTTHHTPSTHASQNNNTLSFSQFLESAIIPVPRRRSSTYSQQSESSIPTTHPQPQSQSQPRLQPSPPTHAMETPRTPPPPPRIPPTLSSWSQNTPPKPTHPNLPIKPPPPPKRTLRTDMLSIARDARETWKKNQRGARQDRLKQSIRVLGPTDPYVVPASLADGGVGEQTVRGSSAGRGGGDGDGNGNGVDNSGFI